jgi:hypothetical protein
MSLSGAIYLCHHGVFLTELDVIEVIEEDQLPPPPEYDYGPRQPPTEPRVRRGNWRRRIGAILFLIIALAILFAPLLEKDVERYDIEMVRASNQEVSTLCEAEIRDEGVGGEYRATFYVENETATASKYIGKNELGIINATVSDIGSYFCHVEVDAPKDKESTSLARVLYEGLMGQ